MKLEELLAEKGKIVRPIEGDSMMPMLNQEKDLVQITTIAAPLKKGDLPLYKRPSGQYVLHRIIALRKDYALICGDNRTAAEKVPYAWMIGIAEGFYKNGKYIPCTDKSYLEYVSKQCRKRRFLCSIFRFPPFRLLQRLAYRFGKKRKSSKSSKNVKVQKRVQKRTTRR